MSKVPSPINRSPAKAWLRALELTAPIEKNPHRIFPSVIEVLAEKFGDKPALLSDAESFTYRDLATRSNRYARWAFSQGLQKGDVVCLLMPNRPEYMAIWLGITNAGGVVALLNTNLRNRPLAHSINVAAVKHIIVAAELMDAFRTARAEIAGDVTVWTHGSMESEFRAIDHEIEAYSGERLSPAECCQITIDDVALYIYTSGTTGLPKAARVSHYRLMQTSYWFSGIMDARSSDRMYDCLPMYHIVGGVQAIGAVLVAGGSVMVSEKFSARQFWNDLLRWDCTLFQYIGELCRYLLHTEPNPHEIEHQIRLCCGNGLRADIWNEFKSRFRIPQILEFYGSTEGNVSLFNLDGKPGAIGRLPSFLAHRFPAVLVKFDAETESPIRDEHGFCIRCSANETGEAIGKIHAPIANRFDGYTSKEASERKILRNVFEPGDTWFRTGDLLRKDEDGYFYFVDRVGDTFRWKGENVATMEVSEAICAFPGIQEANVYGVAVPGVDGRAGMAAIVAGPDLDLVAFRNYLIDHLPHYARPLFLRLQNEIEVTATFKYIKNDLARDGYDPAAIPEPLYLNHPERNAFVQLDKALFERIQTGQIRL